MSDAPPPDPDRDEGISQDEPGEGNGQEFFYHLLWLTSVISVADALWVVCGDNNIMLKPFSVVANLPLAIFQATMVSALRARCQAAHRRAVLLMLGIVPFLVIMVVLLAPAKGKWC